MSIEKIEVYRCSDGEQFETKEEAEKHEDYCKRIFMNESVLKEFSETLEDIVKDEWYGTQQDLFLEHRCILAKYLAERYVITPVNEV